MAVNFLDIPRLNPGYREGRAADYDEVEIRPSRGEVAEQAKRCMNCGIPFCHGAGCPLSNNIPDFNAAVRENRLRDAYFILAQTSPFPEFTSRVCPALCEASCTAGLPSEPVAVRQIEYEIIENAFRRGYVEPFKPRVRTGMRVAVVGSGPSGLAAADALAKKGHEVVVFEKNVNFGGLLRYGIPDFKLKKGVVERRLDILSSSGITFEGGVEIGADISAEYLRRKFDALCVCIGTPVPRGFGPNVEGRGARGVHFALEFLSSQNRVVSGESAELSVSAKGKKVLVVGGGDTGSDCVGTAVRQGAKSVVQVEIMPEPPAARHPSTPWPMWPYKLRTSSSHLEGCERLWAVNVKSVEVRGGFAKSATLARCEWAFDESGRPRAFSERPGEDFKIDADLILLSMGFTGVEKNGIVGQLGILLNSRSTIAADAGMSTNVEGVFAAGDCVSGPSLVVRAAASGLAAAGKIDAYLNNIIKT